MLLLTVSSNCVVIFKVFLRYLSLSNITDPSVERCVKVYRLRNVPHS
nr:MAG TPA: hypothetical protein [Caudoviricetes sp.]